MDGQIRIKTELDVKSFKYQIKDLEKTLKLQNETLNKIKNSKDYVDKTRDIREYQIEIEKTTNKLIRLKELQEKETKKIKNVEYGRFLNSVSNIQYNANPNFQNKLSMKPRNYVFKASGIESNNWDTNNFQYMAENVKDLKKNTFPQVESEGKKAGKNISKSFSSGVSTLKKFGLTLFGIRTAFSLVSKVSNAYLSQHTDTATKLQSIWTALGNLIGPILDGLANGVLKIVGYLDVFLKAVSNGKIDITKGMFDNKKAVDSTAESMEELNKQMQTYSFDEMNIEQDNSNTSSSSSVGSSDTLDNSQFKMPELNPKIVEFLENMAKWFQENWDWIWKVGAALGAVFGISKISGWLENIGLFLGGKTGSGLIGLSTVLKGLATIGVIAVGVDLLYNAATGRDLIQDLKSIYDYLSEGTTTKLEEDLTKSSKAIAKSQKEWIDGEADKVKAMERGSSEAMQYFNRLTEFTESAATDNEHLARTINKMTYGEYVWADKVEGKIGEYNKQLMNNYEIMYQNVQAMADMYVQGKLTSEQERIFLNILNSLNGSLKDGVVTFKDLDGNVLDASAHLDKFAAVSEATSARSSAAFDDNGRHVTLFDNNVALLTESSANFSEGMDDVKENMNDISKETENVKNSLVENIIKKFASCKASVQDYLNKFKETKDLKSNATISIKTNTATISEQLEKLSGIPLVGSIAAQAAAALKKIKLSTGAIINNPGRGVPIGYEIIGGEHGAEGVLPLTDGNAMATLGQEIGKWITLNITLNSLLNGRIIQKETKKISNQDGYLTNGRGM